MIWNGSKLRDERSRLRMSQMQLADEVGVTQSHVSAWESGTVPNAEHLWRLLDGCRRVCARLGVAPTTIDVFWDER